MRITDRLREFIAEQQWCAKGTLTAIADRIDAEHERACKEQYACGAEHGIGASIEASMIQEHGFIELPKDAEGVPIRVGDVMDKGKVTCIRDCGKGWEIVLNNLYMYDAPSLHHHKLTVEDLLREFGRGWHEQMNGPEMFDVADYVERYAAKLRLANSEE